MTSQTTFFASLITVLLASASAGAWNAGAAEHDFDDTTVSESAAHEALLLKLELLASTVLFGEYGAEFGEMVDAATGLPSSMMCMTYQDDDTPLPPFKTGNGADAKWDQGDVAACVYVSLLNANISVGVDDTDGRFDQKFRDCLEGKGVEEEDLYDGVWNFSDEERKIHECKAEVMAEEGMPVEITAYGLKKPFGDKDLIDYCEQIKAALEAGGAATIAMSHSRYDGHEMEILDIICHDNEVQVKLGEPTNPNRGPWWVTVDDGDDVSENRSRHPFATVGTDMEQITIEVPVVEEEEEEEDE